MRIDKTKTAILFSVFLIFCLAVSPVWAADQEVTNGTDSGPGSLRQAIANVGDGETITFSISGSDTVTLTSADIDITKGMTIDGINQQTGNAVTVQTTASDRVFNIAINQADKTVAISNLTITGGNVAGHGGGILFNTTLATVALNLENSTISGNTAFNYGGGLYQQNGGVLNLDGCTVSGNTARDIGGGLNINTGTAIIRNSTISGNTATNWSGGIGRGLSVLYLINTTISGNDGGVNGPGGFYNSTNTYLLNTIVINNTKGAGVASDICNGSGAIYAYYSWYNAVEGGSISGNALAPNRTTAYTAGDLGALQDNGGPTHTMALSPLAPAYQNGAFAYYNATDGYYFYDNQTTPAAHKLTDWATAPSNPQEADKITTDQRGWLRDDPTTIGAYDENPTLIELASFTAKGFEDHVRLTWETASEIDNAGFHLWRGNRADGFYARITDVMIPAEGGPAWGAEYAYEDWDVHSGTTYFYQLEDIDTAGVRTFHGPVSAWPGVTNIKAGNMDRPATATQEEPVSVKVAVQAGDYAGAPVEYWLAADTPFGWYSYGAQGWKPGIAPAAVGPLNDVAPLEVVNFPLPAGWYTFYLAVDDQVNGQPDLTWVDAVEVEVE